MKIYAVKLRNPFDVKFGYEDEIIDFCATKELALKVLEEAKEDYEEFEDNRLYVEEIFVRED